ncbi:transposase domain-containing protein [Streptomyces sp. NBC_01314]|uniref:transposase domain-containing protein n=1 Tax=Streptomyces sp. NBC_01314 TaxID=2903821 RepID=UPI00352F1B05
MSTPRPVSPRSSRRRLEPQFGDRIRLGVLTEEITPEVVDEVLELTGRAERRRRLLPARAVVYFVLALCLFSSSPKSVTVSPLPGPPAPPCPGHVRHRRPFVAVERLRALRRERMRGRCGRTGPMLERRGFC